TPQGAQFFHELPRLGAGGQQSLDVGLLVGAQLAVKISGKQKVVGVVIHAQDQTSVKVKIRILKSETSPKHEKFAAATPIEFRICFELRILIFGFHAHASSNNTPFNCSLSSIRARCSRLRTVPSGRSRISEIASYGWPSISRSTKTVRKSS